MTHNKHQQTLCTYSKKNKESLILFSHTVIDPGTVMIHLPNTSFTNTAGRGHVLMHGKHDANPDTVKYRAPVNTHEQMFLNVLTGYYKTMMKQSFLHCFFLFNFPQWLWPVTHEVIWMWVLRCPFQTTLTKVLLQNLSDAVAYMLQI